MQQITLLGHLIRDGTSDQPGLAMQWIAIVHGQMGPRSDGEELEWNERTIQFDMPMTVCEHNYALLQVPQPRNA